MTRTSLSGLPSFLSSVRLPQPRLLHRVVCFGARAEDAVRHNAQMGAMLLEVLCQPVVVGHPRSSSSLAVVISLTIRAGSR